MLDEILDERVVSTRNRRRPRGVKRKMSGYPLRPRPFATESWNPDDIVAIAFK